jgi:hypothetical protein
MELQGVTEINNILNDFLKPFDCTVFLDTDFAYYYEDNTISYTLAVPSETATWYMEFIHNLCPELKVDFFLAALVHELGHEELLTDMDDAVYDYCQKQKENLKLSYDGDNKKINMKYFALPDELAATTWGINYMLSHKEEVSKLWEKLQPAILNFYKLNNVN